MTHTCHACHQPIPRGSATLRGNGHELLAFHRDCYTVHRAVGDIVVVEVPSMPLTRRLEAVGVR
jgi:hypothetical protein